MCCAGEETAEDAEEGGVGLNAGLGVAEWWSGGCRVWGWMGLGGFSCGWDGGGCEEGGEGQLD